MFFRPEIYHFHSPLSLEETKRVIRAVVSPDFDERKAFTGTVNDNNASLEPTYNNAQARKSLTPQVQLKFESNGNESLVNVSFRFRGWMAWLYWLGLINLATIPVVLFFMSREDNLFIWPLLFLVVAIFIVPMQLYHTKRYTLKRLENLLKTKAEKH